jgi:hypothetical protein
VTFYVNKLFDHPIGARVVVPDFFLRNQGLVCLVSGYHGPYGNNLCFFRCLAVHRGTPDVKALDVPAKTYYHQYLQHQDMTPVDLKGVMLVDLVVLEQLFNLNVYIVYLRPTRNRSWWHRSSVGTTFPLQLPGDHEFEPIRAALQLRQ